jgi:two-component system cell cycle sensor histidine kinase/response regulator CckA
MFPEDVPARRRAEDEIRRSEERYRGLFASNPHPMWFFDTVTLAFLEVNDAAVAHYGYTRAEFLAMTIADIRPNEDVPGMRAIVGRAGPNEIDEAGVWRHRKKDGSIILVEITSHLVEYEGRQAEFVLAHDVTARMSAEANLARLNSDLERALAWQRNIFEGSRDAVFLSNEEGRFVAVNTAAVLLTGFSREELLTMRIPDLHEEPDLSAFRAFHNRILEGEEVLSNAPVRRKDGRKVPVEFNNTRVVIGEQRFMHTVARDVSERQVAVEALAQSERQLRSILDGNTEAQFLMEVDGTILIANPAQAIALGRPGEDLRGKNICDLMPPEVARGRREWAQKAIASARVVHFTDHTADRVIANTVTPIQGTDGRVVRIAVSAMDITERILLEEKLRQSQKMEAVGQLAGGVAHDFNNALMVISGNTDLVLSGMPALLADVRKAGERAANLTRQLLAFGRKQMLAPRLVDAHDVIAGIERMLRRLLRENVTLTADLAADPSWVKIDPPQLEQVLVNLVLNARDAMPQGGTVTIRTRIVEAAESADGDETAGRRPRPRVAISVSDTGKGIEPGVKAHLFEPFFTTKEFGRGSGLGLATSYGFVRQSGGDITVESEPGQGATFTVLLPAESAPRARGSSTASLRALPHGTETILVAEDDDAVRRIVRTTLESTGYAVIEARNGAEALAAMRAHAGKIHLVLSDVVMPAMGGRELGLRLEAEGSGVRLLYMSGYTDEAASLDGSVAGDAFLQKPFTPLNLALKVRELLDAPPVAADGTGRADDR